MGSSEKMFSFIPSLLEQDNSGKCKAAFIKAIFTIGSSGTRIDAV